MYLRDGNMSPVMTKIDLQVFFLHLQVSFDMDFLASQIIIVVKLNFYYFVLFIILLYFKSNLSFSFDEWGSSIRAQHSAFSNDHRKPKSCFSWIIHHVYMTFSTSFVGFQSALSCNLEIIQKVWMMKKSHLNITFQCIIKEYWFLKRCRGYFLLCVWIVDMFHWIVQNWYFMSSRTMTEKIIVFVP